MFKWNIRNQIMASGVVSLLVLLGVIGLFYGFAKSEVQTNNESLIRMANAMYAEQLEDLSGRLTDEFESWTADDFFGIALEFGTAGELGSQLDAWLQHSDGFLVVALIDENGQVVQDAVSNRLAKASTLTGRRLPEMKRVRTAAEKDVKIVNSETLQLMEPTILAPISSTIRPSHHPASPTELSSPSRIGAWYRS